MQSRYTNAVLTIIALCLLWISVKDFIITEHITKTQLETLLEAADTERGDGTLRVHGRPATFTLPVSGSVDVVGAVNLNASDSYPIPVKIEDVDYGVSIHTYQ